MERFDIEKEYDGRYEGLDFDDVDEIPKPLSEESAGLQDEVEAVVTGKSELLAANLEEAEEAWQRNEAEQDARSRLWRHLGRGQPTMTAREKRGYASTLVNFHNRLVSIITDNPSLAGSNVNCLAAQVVLGLAPDRVAKATVLSNFANARGKLSTATTVQDVEGLSKYAHRVPDNDSLHAAVQRALELGTTTARTEGFAAQEELAVRELLGLASISPISMVNTNGSKNAGKILRQLKRDAQSPAIRYAAVAVMEAWKWSILNERRN